MEFKEQRQREKGRPVIFEICISSSPESKLRVLNRISRELTEVLPHIRLILFPHNPFSLDFLHLFSSSNDPLHLSFIFFSLSLLWAFPFFFAFPPSLSKIVFGHKQQSYKHSHLLHILCQIILNLFGNQLSSSSAGQKSDYTCPEYGRSIQIPSRLPRLAGYTSHFSYFTSNSMMCFIYPSHLHLLVSC